ncbi:MAG: class I SAM-dependent methyltransferase, partial [Erythrobacter sp.]|nr:class I SAM-dependent methyltransferase [Erythrobacter sp.]
ETYRGAGFRIVATERYRGEGADGVQRDWYALTLRSPES